MIGAHIKAQTNSVMGAPLNALHVKKWFMLEQADIGTLNHIIAQRHVTQPCVWHRRKHQRKQVK
jgi:hypothetical protein